MLLQNHQHLDILREEDLTMMTSSGEINLYSAEFKHHTQRRVSSTQGTAESSSSPNTNESSIQAKDMKTKRKTNVFSKLGGYKFRKSVPQCRKETRSASWTAIPGEVPGFVLDEALNKNCESLEGLMNKHQEGRQVKQVFNISRNNSLSIAKGKSNSLPMKMSFENNTFDRQDHHQDGDKSFQHESDTNEDSDVSEGTPDNMKCSTGPSVTNNTQILPAGSMRWKRVANKFGIDSLRRAFKEGLTSPSNSAKTFLNRSSNNNSPLPSNNSSGSNLLSGLEMTDSNCSITLSAPDSFAFRATKAQPQHVRRASLAVECMRDSSLSSPFLLSSSSSSLQQQQNNPAIGQLFIAKQQGRQPLAGSIILPSNYDSDNDRDQTLRPKPWQHRNSFQSVLQFPQQQHLLQLHQQQQQQLFRDSLLKIAALDVSFLNQSEAEAWSLTVPRSRLAKLSEREVKYQNHVWELIQTEKNHLRTLLTMQKVFVEGLMEEVKMNEKMIDKLFPALHDLVFFHYNFLTKLIQLQNSRDDKFITEIGPTLNYLFSGPNGEIMKEVYGDFCSRHSEALQVYKESLKADINFQRFTKKCSYNPLCKRLTVPECILLVAQRPTKYPLLIEPILETTQRDTSEHESLHKCLSECRLVLDEINKEIDSRTMNSKLIEISSKVDSKTSVSINGQVYKKSDIFSHQRRLVMEGGAKLVLNKNKQQDVYVVLLSDILLFFQESGQKLNFYSQENKSSLISLKSLLVREKGDSRDCKGLYLICYSDTPIPEMLELSFKCVEERNRWSCAIRKAISLNLQKRDEVDNNNSLVSYAEATPLVGLAYGQSETETRRGSSTLDEATLAQLQTLIKQLRLKDKEICHLLNEKLKTLSTIVKILAPDDEMVMDRDHHSLKEWMNIAFTEGTKLIGLSALSPKSLDSMDSYLCHDFEDGIKIEAPSDDGASECSSTTILPKRAETFAGFDSRKPSKEGNIMARPSSATLNKKMVTTMAISKCQLKEYDQCKISSTTAMQDSICSTTSGVRSSSFEGQISPLEGHGHLMTPAHCSAVGKLLSAVQKISVQAMSQMTEIQNLNIQLATTRANTKRRGSGDSPSSSSSSSSSSFCQHDYSSLITEASSTLSSSSGILSSKSMASIATTFLSPLITSTVMSTAISSCTSLSPPLVQERVKVVRPTFLPFSPLKFQPLYPKKSSHHEEHSKDGNVVISVTSLPPSSISCLSVASSSLPSTPQTVPSRDRCQSFPKKFCMCCESGNFGKCRAMEDLSVFKEDGLTYVGDEQMSVSSTPFAEDFLTDPLSILEAELDTHLNISDSQITILIDSCPDESSVDNDLFDSSNNNYTELNIQELNLDNIACCRSCNELFWTKDSACEIHKLQKSLSTQTIKSTRSETRNNNFEKVDRTGDGSLTTPSSLSLYFK